MLFSGVWEEEGEDPEEPEEPWVVPAPEPGGCPAASVELLCGALGGLAASLLVEVELEDPEPQPASAAARAAARARAVRGLLTSGILALCP